MTTMFLNNLDKCKEMYLLGTIKEVRCNNEYLVDVNSEIISIIYNKTVVVNQNDTVRIFGTFYRNKLHACYFEILDRRVNYIQIIKRMFK